MQIKFKKRHDYRVHDDQAFEAWLHTLLNVEPKPLSTETELPNTSGRALRGLLLNAPHYDPQCATPTFEFVARHYSTMRLWSVYHGCIKHDRTARWEIKHQVNSIMLDYQHQSMTVTALAALLYVLVSAEHAWIFNAGDKHDLQAAISDIAKTLLDNIHRYRTITATSNPISFTYIDAVEDCIVCILNRPTLAAYLRDGGDWDTLTQRVQQDSALYPTLSHPVFVD